MKKIISILMLLAIIATIMCGCGSGSGSTSAVGKWYNKKGDCLDIRSDNTWDLDRSYGTGTWKLLEDKETYEFTDYYGDTQKSKIIKDGAGYYIDFDYYGNFYKGGYPEDAGKPDPSSSKKNIKDVSRIINCADFSEGLAVARISDASGVESEVLINTDGDILLERKSLYVDHPDNKFSNGVYFFKEDDVYYIINNKGEIVATSEDHGFTDALVKGDGMVLVLNVVKTPSEEKTYYGVIDNAGNWVLELTEIKCIANAKAKTCKYAGDGMFVIDSSTNKYIVLDSETGKYFYVNRAANEAYFHNGTAFVGKEYDGIKFTVTDTTPEHNEYEAQNAIALNKDGTFKEIKFNINYSTDSKVITYIDNHATVTDVYTGSSFVINDYTTATIKKIDYSNGYGFVHFTKGFFSVMDESGNMKFEPIECYGDPKPGKEYIAYSTGHDTNECRLVDTQGNTVLTYNCKTMGTLSDGLIRVEQADTWLYIDIDGNVKIAPQNT